jgi:hypothetical protein
MMFGVPVELVVLLELLGLVVLLVFGVELVPGVALPLDPGGLLRLLGLVVRPF